MGGIEGEGGSVDDGVEHDIDDNCVGDGSNCVGATATAVVCSVGIGDDPISFDNVSPRTGSSVSFWPIATLVC